MACCLNYIESVWHLYQMMLSPYEAGDYTTFLRARYLRFVNVALFFVVPVIIVDNLLFLEGWHLELLLPLGMLFVISALNLVLLSRGKLVLAAHTLFWSFMAGVWAIMFTDQSTALVRTNTIVFAFAVLSMLPLLIQEKRWLILIYIAMNIGVFVGFALIDSLNQDITPLELRDYLLDTIISFVFVGIAAFGIFTVSQKALQRTQRDIRELDKTRHLLNRIVNAMPSAVLAVDENARVTSWNEMAAVLSGTTSDVAIDSNVFEIFPLLESRRRRISDVISGASAFEEKKVLLEKDVLGRMFDLSVYPLEPRARGGAVIRLDDVTSQVAFEYMMVHSEKMLSVGGLAAGMAHEINNPLGGILQSIQVIDQRLNPELAKNSEAAAAAGTSMDSIRKYLADRGIFSTLANIDKSGKSAARIVASMLSFSRKGSGAKVLCNLPELLNEVIEIAGSDYNLKKKYDFRKINFVKEFDANLPSVSCEPDKIQQVLLNILRNGAQAMMYNDNIDVPPTFRVKMFRRGNMVCIEIADNGPGMDRETCRRVFEPFFTTKEVGQGTGLGLSVSYFIITESHKGTLEVDSTLGQGTTFTIGIPWHTTDPPGEGAMPSNGGIR